MTENYWQDNHIWLQVSKSERRKAVVPSIYKVITLFSHFVPAWFCAEPILLRQQKFFTFSQEDTGAM